MTTTSRDRPPVMPITSPGPLVAPSTRRGPVPDAKIGSTVRSPQGLRRRRRGNEHHRRVVRGDDRNVPDATRWGERASFEPTIAVRAEVDAKVAKCSRRRGGILKRTPTFFCRLTLLGRRMHSSHSQARMCGFPIFTLFITLTAHSAHQHMHLHMCMCISACCTLFQQPRP